MNIKSTMGRYFPKSLRIYIMSLKSYHRDLKRFGEHSNRFHKYDTERKIRARLSMTYHVLEKGITMPSPRLGFGKDKINELAYLCKLYRERGYDQDGIEFAHSIAVLREYLDFHKEESFELEKEIEDRIIRTIGTTVPNHRSKQHTFTKNEYFKHARSNFKDFALSRHSLRNFEPETDVPIDLINDCIEISLKSPSACNRQPNRVHIVKNKDLKQRILDIQNGNRGFGFLANTLLVITSDLSAWQGLNERHDSYFNSGLFTMSLLYALHFREVGTCSLNWSSTEDNDNALRSILNIPDNEVITMIIACGIPPQNFKIALSPRSPITEITSLQL